MNRSLPLQRIAIVAATVASLATLGFAMAAGPETAPVVDPMALTAPGPGVAEPGAAATDVAAPTPVETIEIDTVYVEAAATPRVIQEVRRATPAPATAGGPTTAAVADGTTSGGGDAWDEDDDHEDDDHGERDRDDDHERDDHDDHDEDGDD